MIYRKFRDINEALDRLQRMNLEFTIDWEEMEIGMSNWRLYDAQEWREKVMASDLNLYTERK
ncbi:MAG: hypothetical protein DWQ19_11280 [Crenarchaeota archaeon]|nr:MAG: hypothetical protein DWQ19_11280 [Thermoproteota archaeon]